MGFSEILPKWLIPLGVVVLCAAGLGGCFDLGQKVAIGRDGSGGYAISVTADGIVGDGLRKKHAEVDVGDMRMTTRVSTVDGKTVQTSGTGFHDLSDLKLSDETISLRVKGKALLGLGDTHVNFHRSFRVDRARDGRADDDSDIGRDILTSMFGDHTYTFSVWLPGTIDHAAPVDIGGRLIAPTVAEVGDGHSVTWRMKLTDMFLADRLDFDVDFSSRGDFHDAASRPATHHRHHTEDI
ncbi:MAG: hypothetical protein WDM86_08645 [Rhizomicrobium sp.]